MRKPVKRMAHNQKSKPKPKPVSAKPKPKTAAKKCKPCKPCKQQYIYHHIHHTQHGENIGDFAAWDAVKSGLSSIKEKIVGHTEPQPSSPTQPKILTPRRRVINQQKFSRAPTQEIPQMPKPEYQPPPIKNMYAPPTYTPPEPQPRQPTLGDQWRDALNTAGGKVMQKVEQAVTPQGAYNIAKAGATGAYKAGKFAVDESYKGMKWLDEKRQADIAYKNELARQKRKDWYRLKPDQREDILAARYMEAEMRHKLKQMRRQAEEYELDRADAYLSGRRFTPKVFKVNDENSWGEPKYMDEYGRELPGLPEEVRPKGYTTKRPKSESKEISDIFGFGSGVNARAIPSPLSEPAYEPRQVMGADEMMYDQPRRRTRYAAEPPQYSSQRRISGGVSPRREADDIRRLLM